MMYSLFGISAQLRSLTLAAVAVMSTAVFAHEEFRVIGTLTSSTEAQIEVQDRHGKTLSITVDKQTVITKDAAVLDASDLAVGNSVVVDALGDSEEDLLAIEIRIVPPIGSR